MTLLLALRIFGPIELPALAEKLNLPLSAVLDGVEDLADAGLIHPVHRYEWGCTQLGRRQTDGHEVEVVVRDESRACVGVSA